MSFSNAQLDHVLALVQAGPAELSGGRLLCLDGPAGSGKTTLAHQISTRLTPGSRVVVIHLDELLDGWEGALADAASQLVNSVLDPLARGERASYRRYDWVAGRFAERVPVPASDLLIAEGVGAGARAIAPYRSALVWLEADPSVRKHRGISRDGDVFAQQWDAWAAKEAQHFAAERTRAQADLVISTQPSG